MKYSENQTSLILSMIIFVILPGIAVFFTITPAYAKPIKIKPIKNAHCNQVIYDAIYRHASEIAISEGENAVPVRNEAIETLRQLCYGQISTFEKKNPLNANFTRRKVSND